VINNADSVLLHPYDGEHRWCCNRPLSDITFEDCQLKGLSLPAVLCSDTAEPLSVRLKNCLLTKREGIEDFAIFEAKSCKLIELDGVKIEGFDEPYMTSDRADNIVQRNGDIIKVKA
jgi:hypothetical protein